MTLQEIIDLARRRLANYEPPYLWLDAELVDYANNAVNTICRETMILEDSATPATCYLTMTTPTIEYALDSRVLSVKSASISGYNGTITQTGVGLSDLAVRGNYSLDATNTAYVVYVDGASTVNTFKWSNDSGATWEATGVSMTGDWQALDNGMYIKFTATTGHTLTNSWAWTTYYVNGPLQLRTSTKEMYESWSNWRKSDVGEPTRMFNDYVRGYMSFHVPPQYSYLVNMRTIRYPISQLTTTTMSGQTPEIPANLHYRIIDGILADAYLRSGSATFDDKKSMIFRGMFMKSLEEIKRNSMNLQGYSRNMSPAAGCL